MRKKCGKEKEKLLLCLLKKDSRKVESMARAIKVRNFSRVSFKSNAIMRLRNGRINERAIKCT